MNNSEKILVYTFYEKANENLLYFSEENFLRPPLNYYDISIPLSKKKQIESCYLKNKPFLELFSYKNYSLWWTFDHFDFWNPFSTIIYFIDNFKKILIDINPKYVIVDDFRRIDIIKQICNQNNIKLKYSKFNYVVFLLKSRIVALSRKKIRGYRLKTKLNKIYQINRHIFSKSHSSINICDKILFALSTTYRREIYNFETEKFEKGEHLIEPIIQIINQKYDVSGISLTHFPNFSKIFLEERMQSGMPWFPEESILLNKSKDHTIFLKEYSKLISDKNFQNLFNYKNIQIWNHLQNSFIQMQFEPYFPYYLRIIDSFTNLFDSQKPKIIFLPSETDAVQRCIISVASDFNIKTVGIQHGEGTKDAEHSESNFRTKSNPYGCPYPDKMLLFGNFTKREYVKQGYDESKFIEFCNPNYINQEKILSLSKNKLREKYSVSLDKKIILFTTSRYTNKNYNYDTLVIKKLLTEFKNDNDLIFLIKPHPSEDTNYYQLHIHDNIKNFRVIQGNIIELIMLSDAIISNASSAIVDSVSLKKPVLEVSWKYSIDLFGDSSVVLFSDIDDIKQNLQKILDKDYLNENMISQYDNYTRDHYNLPIKQNRLSEILYKLIDN